MTKGEIIDSIARSTELPKKVIAEIFELTFEHIARSIRRERRCWIPGFGTFSVRRHRARAGFNPRSKQPMIIPAMRTIGFRPSPRLKKGL
jgi:DNA-binding protein HU-beta